MQPCGCLFWTIIVLLVISGLSYIVGADRFGEFALDVIRLIFIMILVVIMIGVVLLMLGRWSIDDLLRNIGFYFDLIRVHTSLFLLI